MIVSQAHRIQQARLGARMVALLHSAFKMLNPADLDASFEDWLAVVSPLVASGRRMSAQMAVAYLSAARLEAIGFDQKFAARVAGPVAADALTTSLFITGPVTVKSAIGRGLSVRRALDIAEGRSSAAAMRHILNGGRETIVDTVQADPRARGWARLTSGKTCHFCAMLASRGPVYKGQGAADFHAHDGCSCSAEPVFSGDGWTSQAQAFRKTWDEATTGLAPGVDAINAFRRAHAGA